MPRVVTASIFILIAALLAACSNRSDGSETQFGTDTISGEVVVFAASSLKEAFTEIAREFESANPGVRVSFNFAGTPTLRTQLEHGASADVFASANDAQMELAVQSGVIDGTPTAFASNRLVIVTPAGALVVNDLPDLSKGGVKLVLALPSVPVGAYSRDSLALMDISGQFQENFAAAVMSNLVSEETNVRQVVAKVVLGEADAGMAYGTDVTPDIAENVRTIEIPDEFNVLAVYPLAQVQNAPNPIGAQAFVEFVLSDKGQGILNAHGFRDRLL